MIFKINIVYHKIKKLKIQNKMKESIPGKAQKKEKYLMINHRKAYFTMILVKTVNIY